VKKKVLFICFDGLCSDLGSAQIIPYCKLIKKFCYLNICSLEKKSKLYKTNEEEITKNKNFKFDIYDESRNRSIRLLKNIYKLFILTSITISKEKPDFIHCRSYIPMMIICIYKLQKKCNSKIIFDIRGFFFSERLENINKYFSIILKPIFNIVEIYLFKNADLIITLTNKSVSRIKKIINYDKKQIYVIPTVTSETVNQNNLNSYKEYDFIYLGSSNKPYCLDQSIKLVGNLNKYQKKNYNLLVITRSDISQYKILASKYGLGKNIKFLEVEHKEIYSYIQKCKCGLVFLEPGISRLAQFPTKVGEILSQSIPICTNRNLPEISDLLIEFNAGKVIKDFNSEESYNDLIDLFENYKFFSDNAFKLWDSKLNSDIALDYYKKIYSHNL